MLRREDDISRIKNTAYRLLAMRSHSEAELKEKLVLKGFAEDAVTKVLEQLKEARFLDDAEFARAYARNRITRKLMGDRLLRRELAHKGIAEEVIDSTLREAYLERAQIELARELVRRKQSRYAYLDRSKKRKRLGDLLLRRGFDYELIKRVIEEATN